MFSTIVKARFSSDNNFLYWIQNVRVRSVIDTGEEILPTDEIFNPFHLLL